MSRFWKLAFLVAALLLASATPAAGAQTTHVTGGGTGVWAMTVPPLFTAGAPASQFGMGIRILAGGAADGRFNCLMAGRSQFGPFQFMAVRGEVTSGTATATTATFSGVGTVYGNFLGGGDRTQKIDALFTVNVTEGGAGAGTLQLTVVFIGTPPPGIPGVVAFPPEQVASGQISIQ